MITTDDVLEALYKHLGAFRNPYDEPFADIANKAAALVLFRFLDDRGPADVGDGDFEAVLELSVTCEDEETSEEVYRWAWHELDGLHAFVVGGIYFRSIGFRAEHSPSFAPRKPGVTSGGLPGVELIGTLNCFMRKAKN